MNALNMMLSPGGYDVENAEKVIRRPLDPKDIKERDAGFGKKLKYVSGKTVNDLLNEAFGRQWSYNIISKEIIKSEPKYNKNTKEYDPQPSYVEVLGRLSIPGIGEKEQYGTKILLGGASEQEGASKAAATDALKKCATLVGIGIELYEDTEDTSQSQAKAQWKPYVKTAPPTATYSSGGYQKPATENTGATTYSDADIAKLRELKETLNITTNSQLDPYVKEFTGDNNTTYRNVTPNNITLFNTFLGKKVQK